MIERACRLCGRPGNVPTVAIPGDPNLPLLNVVFGVHADGGPGLVCETCKATLNVRERLVRPDPWSPAERRLVASKRSVAAPAFDRGTPQKATSPVVRLIPDPHGEGPP
jgi:hypothetical protein